MDEKIRVLVAEDLEILREHFVDLIGRENDLLIVGQAANGAEAYVLAKAHHPDVIMMDIEMDDKHDGIIAAKKIIEDVPNVRIVFLTVHEDDETVFNAFDAGAVDYVLKTAPETEIVNSIRAVYQGNAPIRSEIAYKIRNEFSRIRRNQSKMFDIMAILSQLTPTEVEIIDLLLKDKKIAQIAEARSVETSTIKSQINVILKKFGKSRMKEVIKLIRDLQIAHLFHNIKRGS